MGLLCKLGETADSQE